MELLGKVGKFLREQELLTGHMFLIELFADFSGSIKKQNDSLEYDDVLVFDNLKMLEEKLDRFAAGIYFESAE
jgi:hypothetical protein